MPNYQKAKDIFTQRKLDDGAFEEYPLIVQPNSILVTDVYNNLTFVDSSSLMAGTGSINHSVSASYAEATSVTINGINLGNPFSSPGLGLGSEQFGHFSTASGYQSVAIGANTKALDNISIALGEGAQSSGPQSTALGPESFALDSNSVACGYFSTAEGIGTIAIGANADIHGPLNTGIGDACGVVGESNVVVGSGASANFCSHSVAIGVGAGVLNHVYAAVFGADASATSDNQITLGRPSDTVNIPGTLSASSANFKVGDIPGFTAVTIGDYINGNGFGSIHLADYVGEAEYSISAGESAIYIQCPDLVIIGNLNVFNGSIINGNGSGITNIQGRNVEGTVTSSLSASWAPNTGGTSLHTGSTYPITSSISSISNALRLFNPTTNTWYNVTISGSLNEETLIITQAP